MTLPDRLLSRRMWLACIAAAGCSNTPPNEGGPGSTGQASAAPVKPIVSRPAEVCGTGSLRDLQPTYELLRGAYGLSLLTSRSWEASAVVAAGLPVTVTDTVDSKGALRFALVARGGSEATPPERSAVELVFGVPLRAPDRLLTMVTSGEAARFRARRDDAADLDWLEPASASPAAANEPWALGVSRNHLICGPSAGALQIAGAFLSGGDEADFRSSDQVLEAKLDERALLRVGSWLFERLTRALGKGVPDLSLLAQVGAQGERITRLASAKELSVGASFTEEATVWSFAAKLPDAPAPSSDDCAVGSAEELLATQSDATLAAATFSSEASRTKSARDAQSYFKVIGLIAQDDAARASEALVALASARGDRARWALEWSELGYLAFASLELKQAEAASKALEQLRSVLSEKDEHVGLSLSMESTVLSAVGEAQRVRVLSRSAAKAEPKLLASVVLRQSGGRLAMGLGSDPSYALKKALPEKEASQPALSQDPAVAALAGQVAASANLFLYADALELSALGKSPAPHERGPLVASLQLCENPVIVKAALSPLAFKALLGSIAT